MNKYWLPILFEAVQKAGNEILKFYYSGYQVELKADSSPVTEADFKSNEILTHYLSQTSLPIISEESPKLAYKYRKNFKQFWLVDPLDGTKEFIGKHNDFAINIALVENGEPIFGLIYIPLQQEIYYATKGEGAYLQTRYGEKVKLPKQSDRENYIFLKSRSHPDEKLESYIAQLEKSKENLLVKVVGSSVKFCEIALGKADEYTRFNPTMEWDTAAGQVLIEEVGKKLISHETNQPMRYNRGDMKNGGFTVS